MKCQTWPLAILVPAADYAIWLAAEGLARAVVLPSLHTGLGLPTAHRQSKVCQDARQGEPCRAPAPARSVRALSDAIATFSAGPHEAFVSLAADVLRIRSSADDLCWGLGTSVRLFVRN